MTTMNVVDPRLDWFKRQMRQQLARPRNQDKNDWRALGPDEILSMLRAEIIELEDALATGTPQSVIWECADVANFAMMIADSITPNGVR